MDRTGRERPRVQRDTGQWDGQEIAKMSQYKLTRRTFLMGSAAAALAGCATSNRRAGSRRVSPNEKLNIGVIGVGGKGREDSNGCKGENVVALCDVDWGGNALEGAAQFPNAKRYTDFRQMLEKENLDAVTVTTPDHTHAIAAMTAMSMGKHVYVQKPLTYTIAEARMLAEAARKYKVSTQMGNQGHSGDGTRKMCELIWSGEIGQIKEVHIWTNRPIWPQGINRPTDTPPVPKDLDWDLWQSTAPRRPYNPAYVPFKWRGWRDYGCGALGDMACHIADPANWALRLSEAGPISVEAIQNEGMTKESFPKKATIKYEFPKRGDMDPVTIYWYEGGNLPKLPADLPEGTLLGEGDNGSLFVGTKGYATTNTYGGKPRLLPDSRMMDYKWPDETIGRIPHQNHYEDWIRSCKDGKPSCSNFDYSGPFTEWVVMGNLSLHFPGKLEWDAKNMRVTNVAEANQFVTKEYPKGWDPAEFA